MDCVGAEIWIFLSLQRNTIVHWGIRRPQHLVWISLNKITKTCKSKKIRFCRLWFDDGNKICVFWQEIFFEIQTVFVKIWATYFNESVLIHFQKVPPIEVPIISFRDYFLLLFFTFYFFLQFAMFGTRKAIWPNLGLLSLVGVTSHVLVESASLRIESRTWLPSRIPPTRRTPPLGSSTSAAPEMASGIDFRSRYSFITWNFQNNIKLPAA